MSVSGVQLDSAVGFRRLDFDLDRLRRLTVGVVEHEREELRALLNPFLDPFPLLGLVEPVAPVPSELDRFGSWLTA